MLALKSQNGASISQTIAHFDMKGFIKANTKETIEKLCKFMRESTNTQNVEGVFALVLTTA
jgi:hypothetical protein